MPLEASSRTPVFALGKKSPTLILNLSNSKSSWAQLGEANNRKKSDPKIMERFFSFFIYPSKKVYLNYYFFATGNALPNKTSMNFFLNAFHGFLPQILSSFLFLKRANFSSVGKRLLDILRQGKKITGCKKIKNLLTRAS